MCAGTDSTMTEIGTEKETVIEIRGGTEIGEDPDHQTDVTEMTIINASEYHILYATRCTIL